MCFFLFGFAGPKAMPMNNIVIDDEDLLSVQKVLALYSEQLIPEDDVNPIISPLSLYLNLSMVAETVNNEVKADILEFLSVDSLDNLRYINQSIVNAYVDDSIAKHFKLRNLLHRDLSIYQDELYNEEVVDVLEQNYNVIDAIINLKQEGADKISESIRETTDGFLNVPKEDIDKSIQDYTANILTNILYFDDQWQEKFKKSEIGKMDFFSDSENSKAVNALLGEKEGLYFKDDNCAIGSLDFNGGCKMFFILPDSDKTISDVLSSQVISDIISGDILFYDASINYKIPKYDISYYHEMTDILKTNGLESLFTEQLDSPFYLGNSYLYNDIIQCSRIVLAEDGVKAASATLTFGGCAAPSSPMNVTIHLNRPFIYLIVTSQNIILFSGIINNL